MTWHLKDRELEEKIIAIDPDFSEKLSRTCEKLDTNKDGDFLQSRYFTLTLVYDSKLLGDILLSGKDVEKAKNDDYEPGDWNEYPKVTPPEDVWMRVETRRKLGVKAMFKNGYWVEPDGHYFVSAGGRFRPWED